MSKLGSLSLESSPPLTPLFFPSLLQGSATPFLTWASALMWHGKGGQAEGSPRSRFSAAFLL